MSTASSPPNADVRNRVGLAFPPSSAAGVQAPDGHIENIYQHYPTDDASTDADRGPGGRIDSDIESGPTPAGQAIYSEDMDVSANSRATCGNVEPYPARTPQPSPCPPDNPRASDSDA